MGKVYKIDDILDGEFEYQTVREVLSDSRKNILKLCNQGYLFDEEVLDRAGIKCRVINETSGINITHISADEPHIEDMINNRPIGTTILMTLKKELDNKHFPDAIDEEDEWSNINDILKTMNSECRTDSPIGEYAQDAYELALYQSMQDKYENGYYDY